jgi:hypothetical protein
MSANTIKTDLSGTISVSDVAQLLVGRADFGTIEERFIYNLSETEVLWVWLYRGVQQVGQNIANVPGAFPLGPRLGWAGAIANSIAVQGKAGQKFTAGER